MQQRQRVGAEAADQCCPCRTVHRTNSAQLISVLLVETYSLLHCDMTIAVRRPMCGQGRKLSRSSSMNLRTSDR